MSRSQKNARLRIGSTAPQASGTVDEPGGVTQKDSAANVAGDVNRTTADAYTAMRPVADPYL